MSNDDHLLELEDTPQGTLPQWQAPTITRMSLDQTLAFVGSDIDGSGGSIPS